MSPAGRPEIGQPINVRLGDELLAVVDGKAGRLRVSRAEVIRNILANALMEDAHYDPEEYIVTTITIAMPVGPTATGEPHAVTINYGSNSTAAESVTFNANADQVEALETAWMELWNTAIHDDEADRAMLKDT